ncbi:hypothetical protein [Zooshikella harenae]|uniref:Uncharacterized protein n=1 Tax=Zooshikella harenae TaxID=2827238 RepID=A0ABS5ZIR5_9GAMM|nr:hypothetical protein [Zooshikella harenae]MBU2713961.1 hypothetical protein [Zooshikella harenae]
MKRQSDFFDHLRKARQTVEGWPSWKRESLSCGSNTSYYEVNRAQQKKEDKINSSDV